MRLLNIFKTVITLIKDPHEIISSINIINHPKKGIN